MKQHITIEQWEELNKDQKCKLYDYFWEDSIDFLVSRDERQLRNQLSIGQMIEFLGEHLKEIRIWEDECRVTFKLNDKMLLSTYTELCDALWEAVKEVLNETM